MNQRTTVSPAKIRLELHDKIYECELPWDSSFSDLLDVFVGLCSTATFGDKSKLYERIYNMLSDEKECRTELNTETIDTDTPTETGI